MTSIVDLLDDAARSPATVRVITRNDDVEVAFAKVWSDAARSGAALRERVGRGGAVAAMLTPSTATLATLFGGWRAGLSMLSLPLPSRGEPLDRYGRRMERIAQISGARVLAVERSMISLLPPLDGIEVIACEELVESLALPLDDGEGQFVQFTGGSTDEPKGVRLSLEAVAANVQAIVDVVKPTRGALGFSWLPLSHDMGLIGMCLGSLVAAGPAYGAGGLVLMAPDLFLANPAKWLLLCAETGAEVTCAPNFALQLVARRWRGREGVDLRRLRVVMTGAEPVRASTLRAFTAATEPSGLDPRAICPAYGLAEATLAVTMVRPEAEWKVAPVPLEVLGSSEFAPPPGRDDVLEVVSCGAPIPGQDVRVVGEDGPAAGVVEIRGPSLMAGYMGSAEPSWNDGWLATADHGMVSDGELYVFGRADDVIVLAGRKVYPSDIEEAVERFDAVRLGSCAAIPDGAGSYLVVAERSTGRSITGVAARIRADLARRFGTGPTSVVVVPRGSLAKTPSGKLKRVAIRNAVIRGEFDVVDRVDFGR